MLRPGRRDHAGRLRRRSDQAHERQSLRPHGCDLDRGREGGDPHRRPGRDRHLVHESVRLSRSSTCLGRGQGLRPRLHLESGRLRIPDPSKILSPAHQDLRTALAGTTSAETNRFDLAVIGGGVVGCALFRRFCLGGLKTVLLERGADILSGASKGNSAMLHTGFDAPPGSLELACIQAGHAEYLEIAPRMNLPVLKSGAILAAWTEQELVKLDEIIAQAHANNVPDVLPISAAEIQRREPALAASLGGAEIPREYLIDP